MNQIRQGLESKIDIAIYNDLKYNDQQMCEIRLGLNLNIDVTVYNDFNFSYLQMSMLKFILNYNKENPKKEIDINLFQNEKIKHYEMSNLFNMLISNDNDKKIEAYKILNEYKKNKIETIDKALDR
jgi:hypothetical protein